ncbi:MAG: hypothetical protein Kow0031_36400 [Anaerolineae bacterium]
MNHQLESAGWRDLLLWLLRKRRRYKINGNSMRPLLQPGDVVLYDPAAYRTASPRPGDIVLARHPLQSGLVLVKRVESEAPGVGYVLKGDNPAESSDSRAFGAVRAELLLGKVMCRFGKIEK